MVPNRSLILRNFSWNFVDLSQEAVTISQAEVPRCKIAAKLQLTAKIGTSKSRFNS